MSRLPTLLLAIGVLCVSASGLIAHRALQEATPLALGAWRLGFASLFFLSVSRLPAFRRASAAPKSAAPPIQPEMGRSSGPDAPSIRPALLPHAPLTRAEQARLIFAGLMLALHFLTWYGSLTLIPVAVSTLLTCSTPIWSALISLLSVRTGGRKEVGGLFWASLLLASAGVALVLRPHGEALTQRALLGDLLAIAGGVTFALYLWAVDGLRRLSSQRIVTNTYSVGAAILWVVLIVSGGLTAHYSAPVWSAILLAALVPQIFGHTLLNNALRHFSPSVVAFACLAEPAIVAILAHLMLAEEITALQMAGGALVLAALAIVLPSGRRADTEPALAQEF